MADKEIGITEHGDLEEIGEGVYWVHGSMKMGPGMRISRNMTVIKSGDDLTVVNAVRLNSAGEAQLEELGKVAHVVKIGFFHGVDDHYYLRRFGARYWSLAGGTRDQDPNPHEILRTDHLPIPDAELCVFKQAKKPEGALLIHRTRGVLITCDAIQNWPDTARCTIPAKLVCHLMGFTKRPAQIGPPWLKYMTPEGRTLRADFEHLANLEFDQLVAAHGKPLREGAQAALKHSIVATFS